MKTFFIKHDRSCTIATYADKKDPAKLIEIYLTYDKGGLNFIDGGRSLRGYNLHVQPVTICTHEYDKKITHSKKMTAWTGTRKFLVGTKAFSAPKMLQLAGRLTEGSWQDLLDRVIQKNNFIAEDYALEEDLNG